MLLSKENVLRKISESQIFEKYLGLTTSLSMKYRNPLRPDTNPGCFFRESGGRLYFCDFAQPDYGGDCFKIVQILYDCDFYAALQVINIDFNLQLEDKYASCIDFKGSNSNTPVKLPSRLVGTHRKVKIQIQHMRFLEQDLEYWGRFGISKTTLEKYNVYSCLKTWVNYILFHQYKLDDPQYAYVFDNDYIKIYRPYSIRKENKFRTNCTPEILQGYNQLPGFGENLIITSSMKDVMTLYECGYSAIAPQSENTMIPENLISQFEHRFANVYIFYDNDVAGYAAAEKLKECCGFNMIALPMLSVKDKLIKDPSDFYDNFGKDALLEFLRENINCD